MPHTRSRGITIKAKIDVITQAQKILREKFEKEGMLLDLETGEFLPAPGKTREGRPDEPAGMATILTTSALPCHALFMFDPERVKDAEARFRRFEKVFKVHGRLYDLANVLLDQEAEKLKIRTGDERDLSLLVCASLGKALKTCYAINELCLIGFGEDALVLLRSNVNLLINLGFILGDPEPVERATDFIAYSYLKRVEYLKTAHQVEEPPWKSLMSEDELKIRAKGWDSVKIKARAERVPKFHHTTGYAFYCSIEHSDAMALNAYIAEWDEVGPRINAGPSDDHVEVALGHSAMVLADMLTLFCGYFKIERSDIFDQIKELLTAINE